MVVNRRSRDAAKIKDVGKRSGSSSRPMPKNVKSGRRPTLKALPGKKSAKPPGTSSLFAQKAYVDWITEAKKEETRRRRIEQAVAKLAADAALR